MRQNTLEILNGSFLSRAVGNLGLGYYETARDSNVTVSSFARPFPNAIIVESNAWDSNNMVSVLAGLLIQDVLAYPTYLWEFLYVGALTPYDRFVQLITRPLSANSNLERQWDGLTLTSKIGRLITLLCIRYLTSLDATDHSLSIMCMKLSKSKIWECRTIPRETEFTFHLIC